jgi:hypothetical protein
MRRIGWLTVFLLLSATAKAQEPQYFQPPSSSSRFVFRWDALARYDSIYHLRARPDIERGRFEIRPELDWEASDRFRIGVRAVGDLGTDSNDQNARNFDNYRSRGATIERYFVEAKPGPVVLLAGAFGMPLVRARQSPGRFPPVARPSRSLAPVSTAPSAKGTARASAPGRSSGAPAIPTGSRPRWPAPTGLSTRGS